MSKKAESIKTRYEKGYVTDTQLSKYLEIGVITQEEYNIIYLTKHPVENQNTTETENTEEASTGK